MSYGFKECLDKDIWNDFVKSSPQYNLFCNTSYFDLLGGEYKLYFVVKQEQILSAVFIILDKYGDQLSFQENYQGILYSNLFDDLSSHSKIPKMLELNKFLINELSNKYPKINLSLHHSVKDLRSFQWYKYHEPEEQKIKLNLSYTGLIDLKKVNSLDDFLKNIRRVRRREYFKALKNNLIIEESNDVDTLDRLHNQMFLNQGLKRSNQEIKILKNVTKDSITNEYGKLYICYTPERIACSAYLMLFDSKTGFSKYGASNPNYKNLGAYTYLTIHCIFKCIELGLDTWDFLGVNSPNRGDYKISFNPDLIPYYGLQF